MSFLAINNNGAYYTKQDKSKDGLDPFTAIRLHTDAPSLTQRGAKLHIKVALKYIYKRQGFKIVGRDYISKTIYNITSGPHIPL